MFENEINKINKIKIIDKLRSNYLKYENNKSTILSSLNFYFAPTAEYYGLYKILKLSKELKDFSIHKKIIKNILSGIFFSNPEIIKRKKIIDYSKVIITWASRNNFKKDGSINDRYFNINSKQTKKTLWIVIYLDKFLPSYIKKNLNENIIIYKNNFTLYNLYSYGVFLFKKILFYKNFELLINNISNYALFSEKFNEKIDKYLIKNLKYLYMPYEAQPFQNNIIFNLKEKKTKTKIIGYIHSTPLAFPANYIYRKHSPDKIIVNGKDQLDCFVKHLYWPKKIISLKPSVRFLRKNNHKMENKIFLPLGINSHEKILNIFKNLIRNHKYDLSNFVIQKHPHSTNSRDIINFEKKLKDLIKQNSKFKINKITKNLSVFVGSSGAIIEALERGLYVLQLSQSPIIETYSSTLFKNILRYKINDNVFSYRLKNKGKIVKLGKISDNLNYINKI
tara:strand:- start:134 stop:1483 length:1350 start_codon:yes stop_codon:yes gene_type:complete